jgi:hypothetical protein
MSLERMRADWPIVGAAWLITLLAATLLSAGPIYSSAVSLAGLHRVLADAPVASANVQVRLRAPDDEVAGANLSVSRLLREAMGEVPTRVVWSGRTDTFALPGQASGDVRDLTQLGFAEGISDHASLVSGSWPTDADPGGAVGVAISEEVAAELDAVIGDRLRLVSRLDEAVTPTVRIAAVYHVTDPADAFWWGDEELLSGVAVSQAYRTVGPLLTTPANLLEHASAGSLALTWHAFPDHRALGVEGIASLRGGVQELQGRLGGVLPELSPRVTTALDGLLSQSERSLLVSRTGVLLLIVQLAVLAAYAIVLTAGLLVEHRRVHTALLRSRGAGTLQLAVLALTEGLVLALPAALLGPWLAAGALGLLNVAGPFAEIGLGIEPLVSGDAYLASGLAALGCVALLVLPTLSAARTFAAEQGGLSRHETRTIGQRLGVDLALLAVTVIGMWQLRLYGGPLTRSVRGTLGLDPLLVAAPAIGLLAGGVLALRLLPLLAELTEKGVARGRHLVGSLGARQLARRPLRYTRAALLLMLAMAMGIFAVSYGSTWATSQEDQARFQVGADVRVTPRRGPASAQPWALADAYGSLPGVMAAVPIQREAITVSRAAGAGELIGLDPAAAGLVTFRPDLASTPLATLLQPLAAGRPSLSMVELPGQPARMQVRAEINIEALETAVFDRVTSTFQVVPVPLSALDGRPVVGVTVVLRDASGLLHRFSGQPVPLNEAGEEVVDVPITGASPFRLAAPASVVAMELEMSLPGNIVATDGDLELTALVFSDAPRGDGWRTVDLASAGGWRASFGVGGQAALPVPEEALNGLSVQLGSSRQLAGFGITDGRPTRIAFTASSVARMSSADLPVVVNQQLLDGTGIAVGERIGARLFGGPRELLVSGVLRSFPTSDPSRPLLVADVATLELMRYATGRQVVAPDEWWLDVAEGQAGAVAAAARAAPLSAASVLTLAERTRALSADPVALGIIGALGVGYVVAGLFAVIGLAVSAAVSARQRRTEFALLRALGMSGGELSRWLWMENAALVFVSLAAGTSLGVIIGWVVLPSITVTQLGGAPFPPVLLEVPWSSILLLESLSIGALVLTVVVLARVLRRFGIGSVLRMGED